MSQQYHDMDIAIHINFNEPHQIEHGEWLKAGFKRHGLNASVTSDVYCGADMHVVSGPHYAKHQWQGHPNTLLLDSSYYHPNRSGTWKSTDWVSMGWLNEDGGRRYTVGEGREPPHCRPLSDSAQGAIFIADYQGQIDEADTTRLHPAQEKPAEPLITALRRHRVAIGYETGAMVVAGLQGLELDCRDSRNIVAQPGWLELLPYAEWEANEIISGAAWEHLKLSLNQA